MKAAINRFAEWSQSVSWDMSQPLSTASKDEIIENGVIDEYPLHEYKELMESTIFPAPFSLNLWDEIKVVINQDCNFYELLEKISQTLSNNPLDDDMETYFGGISEGLYSNEVYVNVCG